MGVSFVFSIPNISGQKEKEEAVYLVLKPRPFVLERVGWTTVFYDLGKKKQQN